MPLIGVDTTGRPHAAASTSAFGIPSRSPSLVTTHGATSNVAWRYQVQDLFLLGLPLERYELLQSLLSNEGLQLLSQDATADDAAAERLPPIPQHGARTNQIVEAFFFDQPGHGEHERRAGQTVRPELEAAEVDTVVDAAQVRQVRPAVVASQVLDVGLRAGEHETRGGQLAA